MSYRLPLSEITERFNAAGQELGQVWKAIVVFSQTIAAAGGTAFLVGGAVRDLLLSVVPIDFDIEIHHLHADEVARLASALGKVSSVGQSFGILKIRLAGHDVDISLPRRETKTGAGHRDFSIGIDPHMGIEAAAGRRDFTIGAIYLEILTGTITDPYEGISDLRGKVLRLVNRQSFVEDPLRVLRGMQLAARFELMVDPLTLLAIHEIVPMMGSLSPERVRHEWEKILLAPHPSAGLRLGRDAGYLELWHPELSALWTTPQDPHYHPEGTVWEHTLLALDQLPTVLRQVELPATTYVSIGLAVLLHDIGKPLVTRNVEGRFRSDGHEAAGLALIDPLLLRLGIEEKIRATVRKLVLAHHWLDHVYRAAQHGNQPTEGEMRRLCQQIHPATIREVLAVTIADQQGRGPFARPDGLVAMPERYAGTTWWLKKIVADHLDQPLEPILWGRDLVERHWPTGPMVGEAVRLAETLGGQGIQRDEILQILDAIKEPPEAIHALRALVQSEGSPKHQPARRSLE